MNGCGKGVPLWVEKQFVKFLVKGHLIKFPKLFRKIPNILIMRKNQPKKFKPLFNCNDDNDDDLKNDDNNTYDMDGSIKYNMNGSIKYFEIFLTKYGLEEYCSKFKENKCFKKILNIYQNLMKMMNL